MSSAFVFDFVLCGQFLSERGCSRRLNPWSLLSHALSTMKPWRPQCICVICQMFLKFVISLNQGEKKRRFYARMKNVQTWRQVVGFSPATPADLKREFFRACSNPKALHLCSDYPPIHFLLRHLSAVGAGVHPQVKYMSTTWQTWLNQSIYPLDI